MSLQRKPSMATVKRPAMSEFKMGLQEKHRHSKRLDSCVNQLVVDKSNKIRVLSTIVDYVYSHQDGSLTGRVKVQGKTFDAIRNPKGYWEYSYV